MKVTANGQPARAPRVSYLRGDVVSLIVGALLTLYALGWFTQRTVQGLNRDRAVVPAMIPQETDAASQAMSGMNHGNLAAKDADLEFLRTMSDHHEGLVRMATVAMGQASVAETQGDAHMLHEKQAVERDRMLAIIQRDYQTRHQAKPLASNQARVDSLAALTGTAYDRAFYGMTIAHHREGLTMIDQHLSRLAKPDVRRIAEQMKLDQQKEITEFEARMQSIL